jgi:hypothetical protein
VAPRNRLDKSLQSAPFKRTNEIATLATINRELPDSRYFPLLWDHGRLPDGRIFLIMSLFDEWPLATTIGPERMPHRLVAHLRTSLEVAKALGDLGAVLYTLIAGYGWTGTPSWRRASEPTHRSMVISKQACWRRWTRT